MPAINKSLALVLMTTSGFLCGCHSGDDQLGTGGGHNGHSVPTPSPSSTPTPVPTGTEDPKVSLKLLDSKFGVQRDILQQGDLTLEVEQGNPGDAKDVASTDGSLLLSIVGGKSAN